MAQFAARVELYGNPSGEVYARLHEAMEAKGFSRLIKGESGLTYHLPTAEYNISTGGTSSSILAVAKAAAASVWNSFGVIVTESAGRAWDGLRRL
jgi:hypothetical protein